MANKEHTYAARVVWHDDTGEGTISYASYARSYRVRIEGKADLPGSADPAFRGDATLHNPEDLFLTSISACHMLVYLALCARKGVRVVAYEDDARGTLRLDAGGGGRFTEVTLHPHVTIENADHAGLAEQLHDDAHELCFIANSCDVPIRHLAVVTADRATGARIEEEKV